MREIVETSKPYGKEFYDAQKAGSTSSAEVVVPLLLQLVQVQSAADVGCGVGPWLKALMDSGISDVVGIDGDYVDREALLIPKSRFVPMDIQRPFQLDRRFDVAISLEVAEHLPGERAEAFIASLVELAPVILFSAAIPLQGGQCHLNEQWPEYWAGLFGRHNFVPLDCIRWQIWDDPRVEWWYAQNILVYANEEGLSKNPALTTYRERGASQLALVHPRKYLSIANPPPRGFLRCLSDTVLSGRAALAKRLGGSKKQMAGVQAPAHR